MLNLGLENLQVEDKKEELPSQEDLMFAVNVLAAKLCIAELRDIEKNAHNLKAVLDTAKEFNSAEGNKFAEALLGCSLETISYNTKLADHESENNLGADYQKSYKATQKRMKFVVAKALKEYDEAKKLFPKKPEELVKKFKAEAEACLKIIKTYEKDIKGNPKAGTGIESGDWDECQKAASKLYVISKKFKAA